MTRSKLILGFAMPTLFIATITCDLFGQVTGNYANQTETSAVGTVDYKESKTLAVLGIEAGMTGEQALAIVKSRRLPISEVYHRDSALNKLSTLYGQPDPRLKYLYEIQIDSRHAPSFRISFVEDLPKRPGVGIVHRVKYSKKLARNQWLQGEESFRQFREQLVNRFGDPDEESGFNLRWYVDKANYSGGYLNANLSTRGPGNMHMELRVDDLRNRSKEGKQVLAQHLRSKLAQPKIEVDF